MITVLIANMKCGAGKTTIATNLAVAYAAEGRRAVLADADRQRSSLRWIQARPAGAVPVIGVDWSHDCDEVPKGTARLIVDSPAGMRSKRVDALVRMADVVLIPIVPSVFDEGTTALFLSQLRAVKPVSKGKRPYALVPNRVRRRTRAAERLEAFMAALDCEAVGRLPDLSIFPEVAAEGRGIFDLPGSRGRRLRADWAEIVAFIEDRG